MIFKGFFTVRPRQAIFAKNTDPVTLAQKFSDRVLEANKMINLVPKSTLRKA